MSATKRLNTDRNHGAAARAVEESDLDDMHRKLLQNLRAIQGKAAPLDTALTEIATMTATAVHDGKR